MSTSGANEFIIVGKNETTLDNILLTSQEGEELLEYRDVFQKFLDKSRFNYQLELTKGTYRGKEEMLYRSIETIDELKKGLDSIEEAFIAYNKTLQNSKK